MPETPTVRLIERLDGVDDMNRILAVCHITFTLNCMNRLKHRVTTLCETRPDDLDHMWSMVDELALQNAMIMFGASEHEADSMSSLWILWGRLLGRYLETYPPQVFAESFGEVERTLELLDDTRRRIVAMSEESDERKQEFIGTLRKPTL